MELPDIRRRLYGLAFVDEFAPLYALFTLWFTDNDVSTPQLSMVFVLWAALSILLEVPSGAFADRVDRRTLLAAAFCLRAIGIGVWLIWPTVTGLLVGAVLWAVHDAAASGAWEALIHDQLEAVGQASTYGVVIARVGQFTHAGLALGTIAAAGLLALGSSIEAIGWVNVAVHALAIALVLSLPDAQQRGGAVDAGLAGWWTTLRNGVSIARRRPSVFRLTMLGALIGGLFVIDEYVPLIARDRGASDAAVPLIVLGVWMGLMIGGEIAARRPNLDGSSLATMLVGGTAVMAFAVAMDSAWALFAIGAGYAVVETTWVISDARFQASIPTATRATVTSVRSVGEGVVAGLAFAIVAVRSDGDDPTPGLHLVIGVLALVSFLVWKWLPAPVSGQTSTDASVG